MAVDTRFKRLNMVSVASPLAWQVLPDPSGSIAAPGRAQLLHLYGGIALDPPPISSGPPVGTLALLGVGI